jgi:hypothetical protein
MRVAEARKFCKLDEIGESLMRAAMNQMNLSARAYRRLLKLARTIADLAGSETIQQARIAEALQYRPKLMMWIRVGARSEVVRRRRVEASRPLALGPASLLFHSLAR